MQFGSLQERFLDQGETLRHSERGQFPQWLGFWVVSTKVDYSVYKILFYIKYLPKYMVMLA